MQSTSGTNVTPSTIFFASTINETDTL